MAAFISKKLSFILLLCACGIASGIVILLNYTLAGPKLGLVYDILLDFRSPPPVSRDILLIETGDVIEPGDIFPVLMTLSEMGAADLLIDVPVFGSGSGGSESGLELSYRVNDEFNLLERNIRNLFEGIRLGLVSPTESPEYVENLAELTQRGRDRLSAAIIRQDEAGSILAAQAAAVFGRTVSAIDVRVQYDSDRILRRITPVAKTEHIVYHALKPRWDKTMIELTETGKVMISRFERQGEEIEYRFPLDRDGNILIEKPRRNDAFRRLSLEQFQKYDRADREMARFLKEAEALGVYTESMPERIPLILFDYAESLKAELLEAPNPENHLAWVSARAEYIVCLDEFLYGPSEMILVNGYEERIAAGFEEAELQNLRDELIRAFIAMRGKHRELTAIRDTLAGTAASSFCIMGPDALPTALLANTLLTGACITPGQDLFIIFCSVVAAVLALVCIHTLGPAALLSIGFMLTLLCGAAFGTSFIITGYWIDPLISTAACLGGILVLTIFRFCISYSRKLRFRLGYAASVNKRMLKLLVKKGRPLLTETLCSQAVIIAVKNPGMTSGEDKGAPLDAAKTFGEFRREFTRVFKEKGALILGFENDTALACFGSPPQRLCGEEDIDIVTRVAASLREIITHSPSIPWRFGIESGECAFFWSEKTGYTANGRPVARARLLASLAARYKIRAVAGSAAVEASGIPLEKLSSFAGDDYYDLPV